MTISEKYPNPAVGQFEIKELFSLNLFDYALPFTNSAFAMFATTAIIIILFLCVVKSLETVTISRFQASIEMLYRFMETTVDENIGSGGKIFLPFLLSLFLFILIGNIVGMLPYSFTFTSHIAVTGTFAIFIFLMVTILGFYKNGLKFLRMFFPQGAPLLTAPLLIPIEIISYLSRPFSLSVRLCVNMTAGHIMLKVLAGFVVAMGAFGFLPFTLVFGITLLEMGIAILQAYVFTVLTCIYLHDALHMH